MPERLKMGYEEKENFCKEYLRHLLQCDNIHSVCVIKEIFVIKIPERVLLLKSITESK